MGLFKSLFGKPGASAKPETEGEISHAEGERGMVTTTDKQALSFDVSECRGFNPTARQTVKIDRVEGMQALGLTLIAEPPSVEYDPEAKYAQYQLTVTFDEPLAPGPENLSAILGGGFLADAEIEADRVELDAPVDNLVVRLNGHDLFAQHVHMPFPSEHMDLRQFQETPPAGGAFVGISGPVMPLDKLRAMLQQDLPDPWAADGVSRAVHCCAMRLVELGGKLVIANRGGELVRSAEDFERMSGDLSDPECVPFGAWLDWATTGHDRVVLRCWGMLAFGLLDHAVEIIAPTDSPDFGSEYGRAVNAALFAASTALKRNQEYGFGEELDIPDSFSLSAFGIQDASDAVTKYRVGGDDDDPFWLLQRI